MQHADIHLLSVHLQEIVASMHIHVDDVTHGLDACCIETVDDLKDELAKDLDA
jgi:hypothetical protein